MLFPESGLPSKLQPSTPVANIDQKKISQAGKMKSVAFNAVSNFKQTAYNEGISYLLND